MKMVIKSLLKNFFLKEAIAVKMHANIAPMDLIKSQGE